MLVPQGLRVALWLAGQSGAVAAIDLRCSELTAEDKRVLVPNQTIFTSAVVVAPPVPPTAAPAAVRS